MGRRNTQQNPGYHRVERRHLLTQVGRQQSQSVGNRIKDGMSKRELREAAKPGIQFVGIIEDLQGFVRGHRHVGPQVVDIRLYLAMARHSCSLPVAAPTIRHQLSKQSGDAGHDGDPYGGG